MSKTHRLLLALLLACPLAGQALNVCTDASGKSSFQDKPCETRDAAPQFVPVKARTVTESNALDTANRLTGAMGARDVVALRRLLARGFESRIYRSPREPVLLNAAEFGHFVSRALQAAKTYRVQRSCRHDAAADTPEAMALRCTYTDRIEVMNRVMETRGDELLRVTVEDGEVKLLEMSELKAAEALRARGQP